MVLLIKTILIEVPLNLIRGSPRGLWRIVKLNHVMSLYVFHVTRDNLLTRGCREAYFVKICQE